MAGGGGWTAARQDKLLEPRQIRIKTVQLVLETLNELRGNRAVTGDTEFATELEQVMLHFGQAALDGRWHWLACEYYADRAIGFIDRAVSFDAQAVLTHTTTVTEASAAIVASSSVYLAESVTH
jgi:hypothetical protein